MAQLDLAAQLAEPVVEGRWSARRSIALAVGASAMLWGVIAFAGLSIVN